MNPGMLLHFQDNWKVVTAAIALTPHGVEDLLLYMVFFLGQCVYILKRAGFSMRAGRAASRRAYVYQNWDILLFRTVIDSFIFEFFRHISPGQVLGLLHIDLSGVSWLSFLYKPLDSMWAFLGLGIASDGLVDWAVDWASRSPKVPDPIKNWLKENVAQLPMAH